MQELRQEIKDINSRPPQPEDPERSLDPDSQEDPDLCVELVDGVFHQLSRDNTLVAIMADYPGLYPASQVLVIEVLTPLVLPCLFLTTVYDDVVQEAPLGREAEPAAADHQRPVRTSGLKRRRKGIAHNSLSGATFLGSVRVLMTFVGEKAPAGLRV